MYEVFDGKKYGLIVKINTFKVTVEREEEVKTSKFDFFCKSAQNF